MSRDAVATLELQRSEHGAQRYGLVVSLLLVPEQVAMRCRQGVTPAQSLPRLQFGTRRQPECLALTGTPGSSGGGEALRCEASQPGITTTSNSRPMRPASGSTTTWADSGASGRKRPASNTASTQDTMAAASKRFRAKG